MVPSLRKAFNDGFTLEKYKAYMDKVEGLHPGAQDIRNAETPVFIPKAFNDVEILSKSLAKLNLELEEKVVQRSEEFKQQKEIAESASSIKDKFVSIVSHDLRAPLLGVSNLLELLSKKDMIPDEEDRNKYITMAWDSIQQCLKLVRQLL